MGRRAIRWLLAAGCLVGGGAAYAASVRSDEVGPERKTTVNGRRLAPYGSLVGLGNFPIGGAATPDGRFYWTVSAGRGRNDVRIVQVAGRRIVQTLPLPGVSGGIAMDPHQPLAYVSGVAGSPHRDQASPPATPGAKGDVIHVFRYDLKTGQASLDHVLAVPPPPQAPAAQDFPPSLAKLSWPDRLAVSPDGSTLLVPLNLADAAAVIDTRARSVRYVDTGPYPYGAAILADSRTGLVSNEGNGTVSVLDLSAARKTNDIAVGTPRSHPEAFAVDAHGPRAYVPLANSDQVVVLDTARMRVDRTLSVERPEGLGASPVDVTVTPSGRLLVAMSGLDELAVFRLPGATDSVVSRRPHRRRRHHARRRRVRRAHPAEPIGETARAPASGSTPAGSRATAPASASAAREQESPRRRPVRHRRRRRPRRRRPGVAPRRGPIADFGRIGSIPTASQPMAVSVTAQGTLLYVSAKGLGTGPNPRGPRPDQPNDNDNQINSTQYLPVFVSGMAGVGPLPSDSQIAALTPVADGVVRPLASGIRPAGTPLRPNGPIKHVFFVVRENRTYDQVLGDVPRGNGDPSLTLFGSGVTPNAHALADRFGLLDHVFANSEASIDGHYWTSAATVPDYVNKNWWQNYAARGRPYDFPVFNVAFPKNGFLLDQATRQGISYFNYGEAIAGNIPLPDKTRSIQDTQEVLGKFLRSDIGPGTGVGSCYPNDGSIGIDAVTRLPVFDTSPPPGAPLTAESRYPCFATKFALQLATGSVPTFNYLVLSNDHTRVLSAGAYAPRAMVADNDEALGRIVDLISHSAIWKQSAIFVVEDDSQDGADHVDAHRIPALVISPYAKRGGVVHTRYDFPSVIRSMELIMGMAPLGFQDALGVPMYDAFQETAANADPYSYAPSKINLLETNPSSGPGARESSHLPSGLDRIPQAEMDRLLWQSVHGLGAQAPPPGPNARSGQ